MPLTFSQATDNTRVLAATKITSRRINGSNGEADGRTSVVWCSQVLGGKLVLFDAISTTTIDFGICQITE